MLNKYFITLWEAFNKENITSMHPIVGWGARRWDLLKRRKTAINSGFEEKLCKRTITNTVDEKVMWLYALEYK